ncbi:MAG: DUF5712 family protein [Bacteroidota bacterium]
MIVRIHNSSGATGGNKGSSEKLFDYLTKEDEAKSFFERTGFFNMDSDKITTAEAIKGIDGNKGRLGKTENKFYMLTINPSERELQHLMPIGVSKTENLSTQQMAEYEKKLQSYTNRVMENYAKAFDKNVTGKDFVYYAKIEHNRYYSGKEAKEKNVQQRTKKEGLQSHVHVVVHRFNKDRTKKLSPLSKKYAKSGNTTIDNRKEQAGFNQLAFREDNEKSFDKMFAYSRTNQEKITNRIENNKKGFSTEAKDALLYSELSPVSDIRKELNKQDLAYILRSELKSMNPISSFLKQEKESIKTALNYAKN